MHQKGLSQVYLILGILLLVILGVGLYIYSQKPKTPIYNVFPAPLTPIPDTESTNLNQANSDFGTVTGIICFPSEVIPAGKIVAKSLTTGQTLTQDFPGNSDAGNKYSFSLKPDTYHMAYSPSSQSDYMGYYTSYSSCVSNPEGAECSSQQTRSSLPVEVKSQSTTENINLCDYYYPSGKAPQF